MAYAPTLTPTVDADPSPRCLASFSSLATGTQTINVQRVVEGRTFKARGGVSLYAVGGASVMDYEVPLGAPVSYRAEMIDASGVSLGFTDASTATVDPGFASTAWAWVSQPLNPTLAVCLKLGAVTKALPLGTTGDVFYAEGATVGTRIGARTRGLVSVPLEMKAQSLADADVLRSMLGDYTQDYPATLLIRTIPPSRLPRLFFCSVNPPTETVDFVNGIVTFTLTADEVAAPFPGLVVPLLRRDDIDAAYATRDARAAAYATRLERDTDYSLAGLSG